MKPISIQSLVVCAALAAAMVQSSLADTYAWTNGASNMTWDTTSSNWTTGSGNIPWVDGNPVVFGSTGTGTITVSGTRSITGLTTNAAGYTLTGGTIQLADPITTFAINNLVTIGSAITGGTNSIEKSGAGSLILTGGTANSFTGGITINGGRVSNNNGASLKNVTGQITVAPGATFNAQQNFDANTISMPISLNGNGSGYDGHGALNIATNATLSGEITLEGNTKITHDWNAATINGAVKGVDTNLQLANIVSGQPGLSVNGKITLGTGKLLIQGVAGSSAVFLAGNNSFTGGTNISTGGGVTIAHNNALGSGLVTFIASSTLRSSTNVNHANTVLIGSGINATMNAANSATLTQSGPLTGSGTLSIGASASTGAVALGGGLANTYSGPFTVNYGRLVSTSGASMKNMPGAVTVAAGATFDAQQAFDAYAFANPITISGTGTSVYGALNLGANATYAGNVTLQADAEISHDWNNATLSGSVTGVDKNLQLSTLENGQAALVVSGPVSLGIGNLIVNGAGSSAVVLSGTLSYTGETKVVTGKLQLTGSARLADTSTVRISSGAVLDLNFTGTDTVAALYLDGVSMAAGTYGSLTSTATNKSASFAGSGILSVGVAGYGSWAQLYANNQSADLDYDHDGVPNGVEYFMGATGSSFTPNPQLIGGTISWPKDSTAVASYVVQTSTNLKEEVTPGDGGWTTATSGVVDHGNSVEYTIPAGDPKRFVRLKVTTTP